MNMDSKDGGAATLPGAVLKEMEGLADEEKAAYVIATAKCPQLIGSETDPSRYLYHSNGNALEAAQLLAKNWKLRIEVFGEERAFLPLDLSGNGALTEEDISILKTSWLALLPNDTKGRTVLFVNAFRVAGAAIDGKEMRRARGSFYLLHQAAEKNRPFCILYFGDSNFHTQMACYVMQCFPLELSGYYGLFMPPPGAARMYENTTIPLFMQYMWEGYAPVTHTVVSESPQDMLQELLSLGFEKESLPECVGGTWSYDNSTRQWY
jgi:hypothetical protein